MNRRTLQLAFRAIIAQRTLIFRPSRAELGTPEDVGLAFETLAISTGRHGPARAWWIPAESPAAAVIFFPGRAENITFELDTLRYLHRLGLNILAVDYPGFGPSTVGPSEDGCYASALAAWKTVTREKEIAPAGVLIYGRSLGAAVASWLAAQVACRGLVLHGGCSSLHDLAAIHVPRWLVNIVCRTSLHAERYVAACHCPVLVLHARHDRLVPLHLAKRLFANAAGPKSLIELDEGHYGSGWLHDPEVRRGWLAMVSGKGFA